MTSNKKMLKILVSGDVEGKFNQLFSRVTAVNKKNGPFEMLICVGNFFGENNDQWDLYKKEISKAPITTYVLGPCKPEHEQFFPDINGCELAHNITYLGRKGILTGSSGLKIAYLSGIHTDSNKCENYQFTNKHAEDLILNFTEGLNSKGVDILLTSQWPKHIDKYGVTLKEINLENCGSEMISKLAYITKPRYHFVGLEGVHYERLPYRNHKVLAESTCNVTRFIALNKVGNPNKEKWLYAFSIEPSSSIERTELTKQPLDVTESPYNFPESICTPKKEATQQFFYNMDYTDDDDDYSKKRKHRHVDTPRPKKHQPQGPCWFCLASPEVEKHLVVSVGDHNYLALAKGGLTNDHILILPIAHHQSTIELPPDALHEIERYKESLKKFFNSQNKTVVFFERNYKSSHLQIQVVPIPLDMIDRLKSVFFSQADEKDINLDEIPKHSELSQIVPPGKPYFYVEFESGEKLFHRIRTQFPLQFGREVLASEEILNIPHCADWKACKYTKAEEVEMASDFKTLFKTFDFTLL
ncbi:CWF19-like protein 1 isoform X1 [Centruroides sculpturatus]|uniref:CWF19-like protein 1 isoform X1 n=2 Tax=Centruroides sculpturatus TaxID=218467 RepID=UPI000C6DAA8D|nr:CWF19-like protein 1 isoform X1 [Centruroides sculpturatus]